MHKVCYCKQGIMSQCVAENLKEQQACWFSSSSTVRKQCMHLNTNMNNHCWSPQAYDFSKIHGVVRIEDVEEEITLEDEIIFDEEPHQRRDCRCCVHHPCRGVIAQMDIAQVRGGLADHEYWDIGTDCPEFMDEQMMKSTYTT